MGAKQPLACRVNFEMAWSFPATRRVLHEGQGASGGVPLKYDDGVVPTIRGIDKFPIGMHFYFGGAFSFRKVFG